MPLPLAPPAPSPEVESDRSRERAAFDACIAVVNEARFGERSSDLRELVTRMQDIKEVRTASPRTPDTITVRVPRALVDAVREARADTLRANCEQSHHDADVYQCDTERALADAVLLGAKL